MAGYEVGQDTADANSARVSVDNSLALNQEVANLQQQRYTAIRAQAAPAEAPTKPADTANMQLRPVRNDDGTSTTKFPDGSKIHIDQKGRVLDFQNVSEGKVVSSAAFDYDDNATKPKGYTLTDGSGNIQEKVTKDGNSFKVERPDAGGKLQPDQSMDIVDLRVSWLGQIGLVERSGFFHERQINGDALLRDKSKRIVTETTGANRKTSYEYKADADLQPSTFKVEDKQGNVVEYGTLNDKKWTVYKPAAGERGLDINHLDPSRVDNDPIDGVTGCYVDQRTGARYETHRSGDCTFQGADDNSIYRENPDRSMTVVTKTADGHNQLKVFRDNTGYKTTFAYDNNGQLVGELRQPASQNEPVTKLELDPDSKKWKVSTYDLSTKQWHQGTKGQDGQWHDSVIDRKVVCEPDGSIAMVYAGDQNQPLAAKGQIIILHPNGSTMLEGMGQDGQTRVLRTEDCWGKDTQFIYKDGNLNKLSVTDVKNNVTEYKQQTINGHDVFMNGAEPFYLTKVDDDGSVIWTNARTGQQFRYDMSGIYVQLKAADK